MELNRLKEILRDNGIAGAGGAGFPSYAKLDSRAETILLNCAECEPLLKLHRQVLSKFALEIMKGLDLVRKAVDAKEVIICLKGSYKDALNSVESYIGAFENMSICKLPEIYPAGDEVVLIHEATGKRVPPGGIPIQIGCIVFNVETVLNIYNAVESNQAVTHKYITVAGEVRDSKTLKSPIGMTYGELIELCGGETEENCVLIGGGPMTGRIVNKSDTVTKTSNAVLVMPKEHYIVKKRLVNPSIGMKRAMSACCQCRMCTDLCPRNALGYPIDPAAFMHAASSGTVLDTDSMLDTFFCSQCGLCEMFACNQMLSPKTLIGEYRDGLRKNGVRAPKRELKEEKKDFSYRRVAMSRLTARLNLTKYNKEAKLSEEKINPARVKIELTQHIGAGCVPEVKKGDKVHAGDIIAKVPAEALGANIHASIDGKVVEVCDRFIVIDA